MNETKGAKTAFFKLGEFIAKWRWLVIAFWVAVIVIIGSFASKLGPALTNAGFEVNDSPAAEALHLFKKEFPSQSPNQLIFIYKSNKLKATDQAFQNHVKKAADKLKKNKQVKEVVTYLSGVKDLVNKNKKTAVTFVSLKKKDPQDSLNEAHKLVDIAYSVKNKNIKTYATGPALLWKDFGDLSQKDLLNAEKIGLPIAAVALFIAFGSLVAAGIPLLLAMTGLGITFGILFFVTKLLPLNMFVQNIVGMIGLGIGIDYSLLIISRFREEMDKSKDIAQSIAITLNTAGRAVLFSGIAVIIAISGLWLIHMQVFQNFAIGVSVVALVIIISALTFLPAILVILGNRVNSLGFKALRQKEDGSWWQKWAYLIMKRPATFFVVSAVLMLVIASPAINLKMGNGGADTMPAGLESKKGLDVLQQEFGKGQLSIIRIIVKAKEEITYSQKELKALRQAEKEMGEEEGVDKINGVLNITDTLLSSVRSPMLEQAKPLEMLPSIIKQSPQARQLLNPVINIDRSGKVAAITIIPKDIETSEKTKKLVKKLQNYYVNKLEDKGFSTYVGGGTAEDIEFTTEVWKSFPKIFGMVFILTFFVLLLVFRSLLLPLKAVLMNAFSVFAAYGVLVMIFQHGIGDNSLGFSAPGYVGNFTPLFLFCIVFGLSMDYEVFLLSRIKEAYDESGDNAKSVALGLEKTGRIITSAAFIMIAVFSAFAITRLIPIKESGIGMAAAIFLDATIVRIMLVPATMQLMGKWNWWMPKFMERIIPQVKVD